MGASLRLWHEECLAPDAQVETKPTVVVASGNSPSIQVAVVRQDQVVWSQAFGENSSVEHVYRMHRYKRCSPRSQSCNSSKEAYLDADVSTYVPFAVRHL